MYENAYTNFARYYETLQECSGTDYNQIGAYYKKILSDNGIDERILLDLACGTGSLSRYFSKAGFDVIGADISPEMLNIAFSKTNKTDNFNIQYLLQNMTELDLFGTIDACICALDGVNHLADRNEVKEAFEKVALFMNPQGVFVFDMNTVHKHRNVLADSVFVYDMDGMFCVWRNFPDENEPEVIDIELDFFEEYNGNDLYRRSTDCFSERAYNLNEVAELLNICGFKVAGCYNWLTFDEGSEDSEKVVFVAVKA